MIAVLELDAFAAILQPVSFYDGQLMDDVLDVMANYGNDLSFMLGKKLFVEALPTARAMQGCALRLLEEPFCRAGVVLADSVVDATAICQMDFNQCSASSAEVSMGLLLVLDTTVLRLHSCVYSRVAHHLVLAKSVFNTRSCLRATCKRLRQCLRPCETRRPWTLAVYAADPFFATSHEGAGEAAQSAG